MNQDCRTFLLLKVRVPCGTWGTWDDPFVAVVLSSCSVPGTLDHTVAVAWSCVRETHRLPSEAIQYDAVTQQ